MNNIIRYFQQLLRSALALHFNTESAYASAYDIPLPDLSIQPTPEEAIVLLLAINGILQTGQTAEFLISLVY
jgi:hypothetical protein